jgi:uncharacterized protein YqjF (DUF2071 family)
MRGEHLLYAHWPVPAAVLEDRIPGPLRLDRSRATRGWASCRSDDAHSPARRPAARDAFSFDEVNVRTYVSAPDGTRGVWFLSLHGHDRAGALAARVAFGVPYHYARVHAEVDDAVVAFASDRRGNRPAQFRARYRPTGAAARAADGSLEAFLTDRLALFAVRRGALVRGDVSHVPWPLQAAEAEIELDTLSASHGIRVPDIPPVLQFARRLDVVAHWPVSVG